MIWFDFFFLSFKIYQFVTFGISLNLSEVQSPHLQHDDINSSFSRTFLRNNFVCVWNREKLCKILEPHMPKEVVIIVSSFLHLSNIQLNQVLNLIFVLL